MSREAVACQPQSRLPEVAQGVGVSGRLLGTAGTPASPAGEPPS